MSAVPAQQQASNPPPSLYRDPQPLSTTAHSAWKLKEGDLSFAKDAYLAPILVSEFAQSARFYPIVFSGAEAQPIAVLGVERRNLFWNEGRWAEQTYVPAYLRRYPFAFIATTNPEGHVLAIDAASEDIVKEAGDGKPLFENGAPSQITRDALRFCELFLGESRATASFGQALKARDLLVDRHADITLPNGRKLGLDGFQVIDLERFGKLDDATIVEWHRVGWLALVQWHLASLDRFADLIARAK